MQNNTGVLLLSHCGFSFLEDLITALKIRGLKIFVLSSLPLPEHYPQRLTEIANNVDILSSTHSHDLKEEDVSSFIRLLQQSGEKIACCISVWEGYRHLMAQANAFFQVDDMTPSQVMQLRNKLELRNKLADAGFSTLRAVKLDPTQLAILSESEQRYFIKPVHGIASYGAFPLSSDTRWEDLDDIALGARQDSLYRSAFNEELTFLAEPYIEGIELSFETLLVDGQVFIVAIHEKCEVTEAAHTVLENCCTSPPLSVTAQHCAQGIAWLHQLIGHLQLQWGCFHIEAKFDGAKWELIETNPRVGGSLISHSVLALSEGQSMLELWLDSLLVANDPARQKTFIHRLAKLSYPANGTPPGQIATFFRVYLAQNGTIKTVTLKNESFKPSVSHLFLKTGDVIITEGREVFLGQLLWQFKLADQCHLLPSLMKTSKDTIKVHYAPPDTITRSVSET